MDKFKFEIVGEKEAVLFEYYGEEKNLVIPEEYNGYSVNQISKCLFATNCHTLETLILPKNLQDFKDIGTFFLMNLKKITFLNENTNLNSKSFEYLNKLEEIDFFAWKHLPQPQLYNVFLKKLGEWDTFDSEIQKQILSIIKKSSKIKKNLFLSNNSDIVAFLIAQKININLETIDEILDHYTKLEMTTITAMLLNYKNKKFSKEVVEKAKELDELVEIGFELPTLKQLKQKWNVGKVAGGLRISGYKGSNTVETIPTGTAEGDLIVSIGFSKTNDFSPIQTLVIDAKIETLGENTFCECKSITSIKFPDTLKSIGRDAFYDCTNLVDIVIPSSVNTIKARAFKKCESLETIVIPDSVTTLDIDCFASCTKLKNISISSSIKNIPQYGFASCVNLEKIVIPNSVENIDDLAFVGCLKLKSVTLSEKLEVINESVFGNCACIKEISFPASLRMIKKRAFAYCLSLQKVNFLGERPEIAKNAFQSTPVGNDIYNGNLK